jgi:hypothetical protein
MYILIAFFINIEATISKLELERDEAELYRKEQEASLGSAATASVAAEGMFWAGHLVV